MNDIEYLKSNGVDVNKSLELLGDMDMYNEVMGDFLKVIDDKIYTLQKYKSNNDMINYSIEVHSLKSDVRYLGFMSLGDIAYELELKSKANDYSFVDQKHDELINEVRKTIAICNKYLYGKDTITSINSEGKILSDNVKSLDLMSQALIYQDRNVIVSDNNEPKEGVVLIADDSEIVANFVKSVLCNKYEVVIVDDGKKAIDLCDDESFRKKVRACLVDINMPNIDGFGVLEAFKNKNYFVHLPVIVISGIEDKEVLNKARSYPIIEVLQKPFNERDIKYCLEKCLALYF